MSHESKPKSTGPPPLYPPAPAPAPPQQQRPQQHQRPPHPLRHRQRVKHGDLYYKTTAKPEWTPVGILWDRGHGHEAVAEIVFDGGIEVCQVGAPGTSDKGMMWKLRWEVGQYDKVHVDEFKRPSNDRLDHIAIQFHPLAAPKGSAVKAPAPNNSKKAKSVEAEGSSSGQASSSMATTPQSNPFAYSPDPARFPLGRLSGQFAEDGYTECLLVFPRPKKQAGPGSWSWAATLTYLSGSTEWTSLRRKRLTDELNGQTLSEIAAGTYLSHRSIKLRAANRGYRLKRSGDTSPLLAASDLPSEALSLAQFTQLEPLVLKRQAGNLKYDIEGMKQYRLDVEQHLKLISASITKKEQELAEVREDLVVLEARAKKREEDKGKDKGKGKEMDTAEDDGV